MAEFDVDNEILKETREIYQRVIESVMTQTSSKFIGISQSYKAEFKRSWIESMNKELEKYKEEKVMIKEVEDVLKAAQAAEVKVEKVEKEEIASPPAAKKAKYESGTLYNDDDDRLSDDDDDDLDDLIKNDDDEKDPDNVIIGVTTGCKTNRGKWKGDILHCVLKRKGHPEALYSKCSCVFDQGGKK